MDYTKWPKRIKVKELNLLDTINNIVTSDIEISKQYTPNDIADKMLDLLPLEIWSDSKATFLNLGCKNGVFIEKIYWRLYEGLADEFPCEWERSEHIFSQIYALCLTEKFAENSRCVLYGSRYANGENNFTRQFEDEKGNIKVLKAEVIVENDIKKRIIGAFKNMTFDVVIGNPPYNKGMDLDFVNLGFDLCSKYCVMITPAKWQTAADDYCGCTSKTIDYKGFREKLVPHMSKVVFYPDCVDVFNVSQSDGISYYIIDKLNKYERCIVVNKCGQQKVINSIEERTINNRESLWNIGNEIVTNLGDYTRFKFKYTDTIGRYSVFTNNQLANGGGARGGVGILNNDGNTQCVGISRILDTSKGEKSPSNASDCTFKSNDKSKCESFVSWLNTKFTRFFVAINISKLTGILTDDYFRFVPAPPSGKFDHIYTDEELYKAFNLPQKYIDVIEAVIKERKIAN